jgi:hypothetical protein
MEAQVFHKSRIKFFKYLATCLIFVVISSWYLSSNRLIPKVNRSTYGWMIFSLLLFSTVSVLFIVYIIKPPKIIISNKGIETWRLFKYVNIDWKDVENIFLDLQQFKIRSHTQRTHYLHLIIKKSSPLYQSIFVTKETAYKLGIVAREGSLFVDAQDFTASPEELEEIAKKILSIKFINLYSNIIPVLMINLIIEITNFYEQKSQIIINRHILFRWNFRDQQSLRSANIHLR